MSGAHNNAVQAMKALLAELPYEFSTENPALNNSSRGEFRVIKTRNVRAVHESLWELQVFLGMQEEDNG